MAAKWAVVLAMLCVACRSESSAPPDAVPTAPPAASASGMPLSTFRVAPKPDEPGRFSADHDALMQVIALAQAGHLPLSRLPEERGYRVDRAAPGSVLALGGLREGDELTSLNAVTVTAPELAVEVHRALRSDGHLKLVLRRGSELVVLVYELPPFGATPRAPSAEGAEAETDGGALEDAGVTKVGDYRYDVERAAIERLLANPSGLARAARIVPEYKDGAVEGVRLFGIRASSPLSALGFRNGDIVKSVNGHPISDPDKALAVYRDVRTAKTITVAIVRQGKPLTLEYRIKP
jgi:type II secretory pathway component PulC